MAAVRAVAGAAGAADGGQRGPSARSGRVKIFGRLPAVTRINRDEQQPDQAERRFAAEQSRDDHETTLPPVQPTFLRSPE